MQSRPLTRRRRGKVASRTGGQARALSLAFAMLSQICIVHPCLARSVAEAPAAADPTWLYDEGFAADERLDFARAEQLLAAAIARDASHARAREADVRLSFFRAHHEGDFAPLRALEIQRRKPVPELARDALLGLAQQADTFPDGAVRGDMRIFVGSALLRGDPNDSVATQLFRQTHSDRFASTDARVAAAQNLLQHARGLRSRDEAAWLRSNSEDFPATQLSARHLYIRLSLALGAEVVLALFACITVTLALRHRAEWRARLAPIAKPLFGLTLITVVVCPLLLQRLSADVSPAPFGFLGVATAVIALAARMATPASRPMRFAIVVVTACATMAAAFLALDQSPQSALAGFGLG